MSHPPSLALLSTSLFPSLCCVFLSSVLAARQLHLPVTRVGTTCSGLRFCLSHCCVFMSSVFAARQLHLPVTRVGNLQWTLVLPIPSKFAPNLISDRRTGAHFCRSQNHRLRETKMPPRGGGRAPEMRANATSGRPLERKRRHRVHPVIYLLRHTSAYADLNQKWFQNTSWSAVRLALDMRSKI